MVRLPSRTTCTDTRFPYTTLSRSWRPAPGRRAGHSSLDDLRHHAGADRAAAFADRETQAFVHRHRVDQRHRHLNVVARHHHLRALRQRTRTGDDRGPEVEIGRASSRERVCPYVAISVYAVSLKTKN